MSDSESDKMDVEATGAADEKDTDSDSDFEPEQVNPNDPNEITYEKGMIVKKILRPGNGVKPPHGADVNVHYVGRLLDGTQFDSSRDRNQLFKFKLGAGRVIKGWDKGVATMSKGELAELIIKPEYGYGAAGSPPSIPPNSTLKFEIELFDWEHRTKVTEDGGVWKEMVKEGEGWNKPNDGARCTIKYVGRIKDGPVFDERTEPTVVTTGDDLDLVPGFEAGLKSMLKGENCKLFIKPSYGFGNKGEAKAYRVPIPPNAHLEYEIELLEFQKGKESWEMNNEQKLEYAMKKKTQGNELFKMERLRDARQRYEDALKYFRNENDLTADQKEKVKELKVLCHSNVAACSLKEEKYADVIREASEALKIDAKHVKSLFRRGQAYAHINDFDSAFADLKLVKQLEPTNAAADKLLAAVQARLAKEREKERQLFSGFFNKVKLTEENDKPTDTKKEKNANPQSSNSEDENSKNADDGATHQPASMETAESN